MGVAQAILTDLQDQARGCQNTLFDFKDYDELALKSRRVKENPVPNHFKLGTCREEGWGRQWSWSHEGQPDDQGTGDGPA